MADKLPFESVKMWAMRGLRRVFIQYLLAVSFTCMSEVAGSAEGSTAVDLSGTWKGTATVSGGVATYRWLICQSGSHVSGTITLSRSEDASTATYTFRGGVDEGTLWFEGTEFLARTPGSRWCIAKGVLEYKELAGSPPSLSGTWGPHAISGGCPDGSQGSVHLERK